MLSTLLTILRCFVFQLSLVSNEDNCTRRNGKKKGEQEQEGRWNRINVQEDVGEESMSSRKRREPVGLLS